MEDLMVYVRCRGRNASKGLVIQDIVGLHFSLPFRWEGVGARKIARRKLARLREVQKMFL
jgi:hypothetical protein